MKLYKKFLHWIIAVGSIGAFLTGWMAFAHSPKPLANSTAQPASLTTTSTMTLPTLEPIPSFDNSFNQIRLIPNLPSSNFSSFPRLRTGGS